VKRKYSHDFTPPAPVVEVTVRSPDGSEAITLPGKLDSGADVCAVPDLLVARLDLPPVRASRAAGFAGDLKEVVVYRIDVELAGTVARRVEAVATRRPYVIVGRNVLRLFLLRLDGPKQELELKARRSRGRAAARAGPIRRQFRTE